MDKFFIMDLKWWDNDLPVDDDTNVDLMLELYKAGPSISRLAQRSSDAWHHHMA